MLNGTLKRISLAMLLWLAAVPALAISVERGPYLQQQDDDSIIVRWRTDIATDSKVFYGLISGTLNLSETVTGSRTEHTVLLTGLNPLTTYYYSVGDSGGALAGDPSGDPTCTPAPCYFFHTSPAPGIATPTRFWAIGDSGTNTPAQTSHVGKAIAVRDAFVTYAGTSLADFMIMLGDNAYNDGTDAEYQDAVFDTYPNQLRQLPVWVTLGNHDGHSADSGTQTGPYFDIFDPPRYAEVGGITSGTEAYYSWDYGNIHFISLDSYDTDKSVAGNMMQWLEADLAVNDKDWLIAIWHHPPYTKGSHDSDTEGGLIDMRQNALPFLEAWGVDLVMSGHSHSFERSFLIDSHYGISDSLNLLTEVLDGGDGSVGGDGAYEKPPIVAAEHAGAVYAVAGSSGKVSSLKPDAPHEAMYITLQALGSLVVDVAGNQLDAVFIDETGAVRDEFRIVKVPDTSPPLIGDVRTEDAIHVVVDFTERLDIFSAITPANYDIPGLLITAIEILEGDRSVRLTTSTMSTGVNYVLTVNNVMDRAGNPILPNSQFPFNFIEEWTVSFQDGLAPTPAYSDTFDTFIREASPTTTYGSAVTLEMDGEEPSGTTTDMYILVGWEVSYIPTTATILSATMHFNVTNAGGPYDCYALLRGWVESEATWNLASTGNAWDTAGALAATDRDNIDLCTIDAGTGPLAVPLDDDGVALVQSWVDGGAANNGIVISHPTSDNGVDIDSRESLAAMSRPRLEVIYTFAAASPNQAPDALFSYSCTGLWCSFSDASTDIDGTVVSWDWDFGDSSGSAVRNPLHQYASGATYPVSLTVTDNDGAVDTHNLNVTVSATGTSFAIDIAIDSGSDDVEENLTTGAMSFTSSDLELIDDGDDQAVGLRFNNIDVAGDATVTSAHIEFTAKNSHSADADLVIHAQDIDDAPVFVNVADDVTDRVTTSASVTWNNVESWTAGNAYNSPDLTAVVQEVVDRPGWGVNNSMVFVITGSTGAKRRAWSFDGNAPAAATLHIEYEGGSCNASRNIVADQWESIALPCDPGVNNQVQQVLAVLVASGGYDVTWIVYRFDEISGTYAKLALDEAMYPGQGYWVYTFNAVTVNFVGEFNDLAGRTLAYDVVNGAQNFVGNYRNEIVSWPDVVVVNGPTEVNIAGADPLNDVPPPVAYECDMNPAGDDCLVSRKSYWWSGSNYDTFSPLVPGFEGEIPIAHAIFVKAFKAGSQLRLPAGVASPAAVEEPAKTTTNRTFDASVETEQKSFRPGDNDDGDKQPKHTDPWMLRLIASSGTKRDQGNVLGQLIDSEDGLDINDLEELVPFGTKYLSLTFENSLLPSADWGFTSDFRALTKKSEGNWPILVRASPDVEDITLSWEGNFKAFKNAWIRDEQTGKKHKMKENGTYTFANTGGENRFTIIIR